MSTHTEPAQTKAVIDIKTAITFMLSLAMVILAVSTYFANASGKVAELRSDVVGLGEKLTAARSEIAAELRSIRGAIESSLLTSREQDKRLDMLETTVAGIKSGGSDNVKDLEKRVLVLEQRKP